MRHDFIPGQGFQEDVEDLSLPARKALVIAITDVLEGRLRGVRLDSRASTVDLSDCMKLYFDYDPNVKPRYRFVYRETPTGVTGLTVVAVAVGERQGLDAYVRAAKNLGRM